MVGEWRETENKDISGHETGAGEQKPEEGDAIGGYYNAKPFFDNISCGAAIDRESKNRDDRRYERKHSA